MTQYSSVVNNKSTSLFPLIILSLLLLTFLSGCKNKEEVETAPPVKPVKLITVVKATDAMDTSLPGKVRAAKRSELSFKVSGPLEQMPVEEGQLVKKGDIIAQILERDFKTNVKEAKANALEAEQQYNRYKDLYSKQQVSKADFDRYRAARDVARARLQDAQNALKDTTLLAPFDGVIAKRYVENFEKVQEKQPIVFLQMIDELEILVDLPEIMMAQFRTYEQIKLTAEFDAVRGKLYPLEMKEYSTDADPATQTYQVVLAMDQPVEANILPGMTTKVNASAGGSDSASINILIPAIAVLNDADKQSYVWVYDDKSNSARKIPVTIGKLEGSKNVIIKDGLEGGERIVVAGVTKLREGMKIRPWENDKEGN